MDSFTRPKMMKQYNHMLGMKTSSDLGVYFHHQQKQFTLLNKAELNQQMKQWRQLAKDEKLIIRSQNNKSFTDENGKEWHILVIQPFDEDKMKNFMSDPFGMLVLGFMVTGYIYAFDNINNRDMIYNYVMKIKTK
jgi:hypothetical protein